MDKLTIEDLDLRGKRVLKRVDFSGVKKSGKIDIISHLLPKVERIFIGGGYPTFFIWPKAKKSENPCLKRTKLSWLKNCWHREPKNNSTG
jgi:3-phosphoglycerate kinase